MADSVQPKTSGIQASEQLRTPPGTRTPRVPVDILPFGMNFKEPLSVNSSADPPTVTPPPMELTPTPGNDVDSEPGPPDTD